MRRSFETLLGLVLALGLLGGWARAQTAPATPTKPATTTTKPAAKRTSFGARKHANKAEKLGSTVININSASEADLQKVPGISKKRAAKIVKARPFTSVDELVTKKIMSKKDLDKVRANLSTQ
jgi:DNA uptake protein ComE-like DNA-binding protein